MYCLSHNRQWNDGQLLIIPTHTDTRLWWSCSIQINIFLNKICGNVLYCVVDKERLLPPRVVRACVYKIWGQYCISKYYWRDFPFWYTSLTVYNKIPAAIASPHIDKEGVETVRRGDLKSCGLFAYCTMTIKSSKVKRLTTTVAPQPTHTLFSLKNFSKK